MTGLKTGAVSGGSSPSGCTSQNCQSETRLGTELEKDQKTSHKGTMPSSRPGSFVDLQAWHRLAMRNSAKCCILRQAELNSEWEESPTGIPPTLLARFVDGLVRLDDGDEVRGFNEDLCLLAH